MTTNFIYEEFHPNDAYDAKIWAQDFLYSLLLGHHREGVEVASAVKNSTPQPASRLQWTQ
ncbi:MAG: hypothetical protein R2932_53165 [Caldilineaceae bacterium]